MSLLLSRLSKLASLKTHSLVRHRNARSFSSESLLKHIFPFFDVADAHHRGSILRNGDDGGYLEILQYPHDELAEEAGTIGESKGWVATLKEGVVCLHDNLPSASDIDPEGIWLPSLVSLKEPDADRKRISLPPLVTLPHCQTQIVTNVAMSSSCPEDDNCVVAIKFLGPQLSLCRPARSSEWTNIRMTDPGFFNSRVMYSKRDEMFNMPVSGGGYIGSWNLGDESEDIHKHKVKQLLFGKLPELVQSEWELLNSYSTSEHLVEYLGPIGKTYLVKWYTKSNFRRKGRVETQRFMVFKINERGHAEYTSYNGSLCIFLSSKAEAFCTSGGWFGRELVESIIFFKGLNDYGTAHLHYPKLLGLFSN